MAFKERIVGFDAREMWLDPALHWNEKRREKFLFRPDVTKPLSTDTIVWPSIFDLEGNTRPPDCFGHQDLCDKLEDVRAYVRETTGVKVAPCYVIAITLLIDDTNVSEMSEWDSVIPPTTPSVRDDSWLFLGFDVSDKWLLSGLSNCGFLSDTENVTDLRNRWSPHLNDVHLFDHLAPATEFKVFTNERVAEHGPFFIFGIWLSKQT
jgi:hypothetical protein